LFVFDHQIAAAATATNVAAAPIERFTIPSDSLARGQLNGKCLS